MGKVRIVLFITTLFFTFIFSQLYLNTQLSHRSNVSHVINLAGRQRMLSQTLVTKAFELDLCAGDSTCNTTIILNELNQALKEFNHERQEIDSIAVKVIDSPFEDSLLIYRNSTEELTRLAQQLIQSEHKSEYSQKIKLAQKNFLANMEKEVSFYDRYGTYILVHVRNIEILTAVISFILILLTFLFVIIPYIKSLTSQSVRLENANKDLQLLADKLSDQNVQLADFAHITSHNLRAPVANLISLMQLMKLQSNEEERQILLLNLDKVVLQLSDTLETLVETLKIKEEKNDDLEFLNFNDILEKTKTLLSSQIQEKKVVITSDFNQFEGLFYKKTYLESIFLNLISNSIKYAKNDVNPIISIHSSIQNGKQMIEFNDNGLGIDLERHGNKVFGLYKTFHRNKDSKGIGLFITKNQIEALGGKIEVESEINKGCTFRIYF